MKYIFLDTDIGADCDDAIALALLLQAEKKGRCEIIGVTAATTRTGATSAINAICDYYGLKKQTAVLKPPAIDCDKFDNYAYEIMQKYGNTESDVCSVAFMRRKLAECKGKVTFVAIGPLTGVSRLFNSMPDEFSPLTGAELFNAKVEAFYCMGGCFNGEKDNDGYFIREWNFVQDLPAVTDVLSKCTVPAYFLPKETGEKVLTGATLKNAKNNPVADCIRLFGSHNSHTGVAERFSRESWDPLTCYFALDPENSLFKLSRGKVSMDVNGVTSFVPDNNGKDYVIGLAAPAETVQKKIDEIISEKF